MTTEIGSNFKTQIPSLSDDANIQEAFRLYHYGIPTEPDEGTPIAALSIESHLKTLSDNIENISAGQAAVEPLDAQNLNSVITSGTYYKPTTPLAGYGYPALFPGLLVVVKTPSDSIYQTYQTIGGASGTNNRWWRSRTATTNDWSDWKQTSFVGHNHDDIYYRATTIDAKVDPALAASSAIVTNSAGKIVASTNVSSEELEHLNGVRSNIQTQLDERYTKSETARIFVQQGTPASPQDGDLWIW